MSAVAFATGGALRAPCTPTGLPLIVACPRPATAFRAMPIRMAAGVPGTSPEEPPPPLSMRDAAALWVENILVLYGDKPARDSIPVAEGAASDIMGDDPFFSALHRYFKDTGPVYKLAFGPKVFIVVQDPVMVRSILRDDSILYDKGILAEILEDIMGKGLIPADYATWKIRRRAIAPGFHKAWLNCMTGMFGTCTQVLCDKLDEQAAIADLAGPARIDMETEFCSLTLDIIGKAVFNYDFGSVTNESPIIKAVYRTLREAEHRSTAMIPYWKIPGASTLVPRQRQFSADMRVINETLNELIRSAKATASTADLAELERRDYDNVTDPSLLRFLVDLRGEETTNAQLRDDLMTMLIAGHETTAALLTWTTFELAQRPELVALARAEIDAVCGDRHPTYHDVKKMDYVRRLLAETLRLYPQPPLLIRRVLADTTLPQGEAATPTAIMRGTDVFINVYSLHRSPSLWENPDNFEPERWLKPNANPGVTDWKGYTPAENLVSGSPLYPNEQASDFAFLPFGGGSRKCVGDQFAMLESVVSLAMLIRRFDFNLAIKPDEVGLDTGATIHTRNGLQMYVTRRVTSKPSSLHDAAAAAAAGSAAATAAAIPVETGEPASVTSLSSIPPSSSVSSLL
jgi:cytochrome P450 family 97 subfamily B polypeptide 3